MPDTTRRASSSSAARPDAPSVCSGNGAPACSGEHATEHTMDCSTPRPAEGAAQEPAQWLDSLHASTCAAYVLHNDAGLSLLCANDALFALAHCTREEMRSRYGNRMGALLDADSLRELAAALVDRHEKAPPLTLKQQLKHRPQAIWLQTEITPVPGPEGTLLRCLSFDITEYEEDRRRYCKDEVSFRLATDQLGVDYFDYDLRTGTARILFAHAVLPPHLGDEDDCCPAFAAKLLACDFICPEYAELFQQAFQDIYRTGKSVCELQARRPGRDIFWVRLSLTLRQGGPDAGRFAAGTLEDITAQKEAARSYLNETRFYQAILAEKDAYAQVDVTLNKITRIGGMWNLYNEIIGKVTYSQLIDEFIHKVVLPEDRKHYLEVMQRDNFIQSLRNGIDKLGCEFRRIVDQNKMVWMQLAVHLFYDPLTHHVLALLTIKNINDQKQRELSLLRDSRLDQLTNIFNRRTVEMLVREHLARARPEDLCAFLIIDMDDFKDINSRRGHNAGDQALARLADILTRTFRRTDVIGRYGGDEFILFLRNVTDRSKVEERLRMLYARLQQEDAPLTCSTGVVLARGSVQYEQLFQRADMALYLAKAAGKNCFRFYDNALPVGGDRTGDSSDDCPALFSCDTSDDEAGGPASLRQRREHDRFGIPQPLSLLPLPLSALDPLAASAELSASDAGQRIHRTSFAPSFAAFLGEQGDIAYLVDPDTFELICGNQAFYDRLGMSEAQCTGIKCYEAMQRRQTPCPFCSKANWSKDKFYLWRNLNPSLEQEFLIKNKLVSWRGRESLLAVAVDISNDKSIVDSLDNGAEELHSILSGVQHMANAPSLSAAMDSAMETIGCFFMADSVRFWRRGPNNTYTCAHSWSCRGTRPLERGERGEQGEQRVQGIQGAQVDQGDQGYQGAEEIHTWLDGRKWTKPLMVENPEAMLCHSYAMYRYMKTSNIRNQRWLQIQERGEELGCVSIENIASNFLNIAFLESFSVFVAVEMKKRALMESALYADRHDVLTDLLSRKSFEEYMNSHRADSLVSLGVVMSNFNNLKGINSAHGFQAGNYFIRQFAGMMRSVFGDYPLFRLNGDEFLAVVPEVTRPELEDKVSELLRLTRENGAFTVSVGHSWDDVEKDLAILIEQATQGMRVNKKRHYDALPAADVGAERRRMLSDLVDSLEKNDFEIFLQPKVELQHGTVVGAEALIRYRDKDMGIVPPAHFIDRLEKNNLVRYIDIFVFGEVCRLLEKWKQQNMVLPVVSLNFSRLTLLERDILATVEEIVSRFDVPRKHIEIEITESVADMGKSVLYQTACALYQQGFGVSLDDFGTKYTNLSMLAELDFSKLKLDRSLTARLGDRMHTLIMKNIIQMCKELGIEVVAEGVESKKQELILQELQCPMGQGYLYGKPMPVAEFERKYLRASA